MRHNLIAGHNVDRIDVAAGMSELTACGYVEPNTRLVVEYALMRWARGEEEQAERCAIDASFHGIDFTSWRRVLAAACAAVAPAQPGVSGNHCGNGHVPETHTAES